MKRVIVMVLAMFATMMMASGCSNGGVYSPGKNGQAPKNNSSVAAERNLFF